MAGVLVAAVLKTDFRGKMTRVARSNQKVMAAVWVRAVSNGDQGDGRGTGAVFGSGKMSQVTLTAFLRACV